MNRTRGLRVLGAGAAATLCLSATAVAKPFHQAVPGTFAAPPTTAQCEAQVGIACYGPTQFEQAYDMNPLYQAGLTGAGKTIAIVDAFGSNTIRNDLAKFDSAYGLPAPPALNIIAPAGAIPPGRHTNWAFETTLDVEYAHAMAPGANILLVETPVAETEGVTGLPQIVKAENYVVKNGLGDVISQSFGATEETFPSTESIHQLESAFDNARLHQVSVLASSGDDGATDAEKDGVNLYPHRATSFPDDNPYVTAVGGTQLHLDAAGNRTAPDNVWNDQDIFNSAAAGGGGRSKVYSRPDFQNGVAGIVGASRGVPDVSLSAAVNGGALVYLTFFANPAKNGWHIVGGTSEASPLFSGIVAVADQAAGHDLGDLNPQLYKLGASGSGGLVDITRGDNTVSFTNPGPHDAGNYTVNGFDAVPGYDLASGLGTVDGARLVAALAGS